MKIHIVMANWNSSIVGVFKYKKDAIAFVKKEGYTKYEAPFWKVPNDSDAESQHDDMTIETWGVK
jgi:hypothetical protein